MNRKILFFSLFMINALLLNGQETFKEKVEAYVDQYKDWAMMEQIRTGVPAAITLAQGILETGAGESELCNNANNHFGIKCKKNWEGQTYSYTDDARDECFRMYESAYQSYIDHSDFLKTNPRYKVLFSYDLNDYKSWSHGLKKCGYATNPHYGHRLIKFIEEYRLHEYTLLATNGPVFSPDAEIIAQNEGKKQVNDEPLKQSFVENTVFKSSGYDPEDSVKQEEGFTEYYITTKKNNLKGFYARKGDMLLEYALNSKIRYSRLLLWNDLEDKPLSKDMFIYLEAKHKKGLQPTYTVKSGEDLHWISQEEGIQLSQLMHLNKLTNDEEPAPGTVLYLQEPNPEKVETLARTSPKFIYQQNNNAVSAKTARKEDTYITISQTKAEPIQDHALDTEEEKIVKTTKSGIEIKKRQHNEESGLQVVNEATESAADNNTDDRKDVAAGTPQTPLEKLKAYMDNTVYAQGREDYSSSDTPDASGQSEAIPTLPARKMTASNPVPASNSSSATRFHTVKKGDNAYNISKQYNITLQQLRDWNKLPASMVVQIGQKLQVSK